MSAPVDSPYAAEVYARLLQSVPRTDGGRRLWRVADPYLLRHAAQHAQQAHRGDELLLDADFLAEADPEAVLAMSGTATTRQARVAATVYRASYAIHHRLGPHERRQILALDAARFQVSGPLGHDLARGTPWRYLWATGQQASTALTATLEGHSHEVTGVAVTVLNGHPVAVTSGFGGRVRVWDLATGLTTHILEGHTSPVTGVAVSDLDGLPVAVTVSWDGTMRVWDLAAGQPMGILDTPTEATVPLTGLAALSVGGRTVAVTTAPGGTAWAWEVAMGRAGRLNFTRRALSLHSRPVLSVAAAVLDGRPVAVITDYDGTATVRDLDDRGRTDGMPLTGHRGWVLGAALTMIDGRPAAVTAGRDRTARVWDLVTGQVSAVLEGHTDWVTGVAAAHLSGRPMAVTSSRDGTARVWDLTTGRMAATTTVNRPGEWLTAVAMGDLAGWPVAVTAGQAGTVQVWDLSASSTTVGLEGHTHEVTSAAAADVAGRTLAVTGSRDGTARVWDVDVGLTTTVLEGHEGPVTGVALAAVAGERPIAVTVGTDGTARMWDPVSGRTTMVLDGHTDRVTTAALTVMDGRTFAVTAGADGKVRIWDAARRHLLGDFDRMVRAMAVGVVDGRSATVCTDGQDLFWVWDLDWAASLVRLERDGPPLTAVAVAGFGARAVAVTGDIDGTVQILDVVGGSPRAITLDGHTDRITDIAVLDIDGVPRVVTTGRDRTARLWDPVSGRSLATLALPDVPHSVAVGTEGRIVLGMGHEVVALKAEPIPWRTA